MWKLISPNANMRQLLITKLDGISATYSQALVIGNANISGAGAGDAIPQGACVVTVQSDARGKANRNRMYLPFVGESEQAAGVLTAADVTAAQTAWTAFHTAMLNDFWVPTVISPSKASPLANQQAAARYVVRSALLTQRRRAKR
jgi:hypothetical protein